MNKNKRILLMTLIIYVIISNIHLYLYYLKNEIPSYQRCLNNQETLFKKIQSKSDLYDNIEYLDKRFFKKNPVLSTNCPDGGIFFIKDKKIHCTFHGNADNLKVKNFLSLILNKEHYLIILSEMIFSAFFLFFISYMLALNGDRIFSFFIPIIFIYIIALTRFFPFFFRFHVLQLFFTGNIRFVILSISVVCISGFFFKNIDNIRMKFLFMIFCILSFLKFGILPFYSSIPAYDDFLNSLNIYIENGLLYQSTSYSCGPAAAAIALENMGYTVFESQIALVAGTSSFSGTSGDSLCKALNNLYNDLECEEKYISNLENIRGLKNFLAVIKYSFLIDHYVCIFKIEGDNIYIGDPADKYTVLSIEDFRKIWRNRILEIKRN